MYKSDKPEYYQHEEGKRGGLWVRSLAKQGLQNLFSFETTLVLFLFAGSFKSASFIQSAIPIDLTLLFFILSLFTGFIIMIKKKLVVKISSFYLVTAYVLFATYSVASMIWSPSVDYAREKGTFMLLTVFWSLAASSLIISNEEIRVKRFLLIILLLASWQAFQSFQVYLVSSGEGFITVMGASYLGTGQIIGLGALVLLSVILFSKHPLIYKLFAFFLFIIMLFILLILGGRGPLLATLLAMLLTLVYAFKFDHFKLSISRYGIVVLILIFVSILVIGYLIASGNETQTLLRLMMLFEGSDDSSAGTRAVYYGASIEFWKQAPLVGQGLGSWPVLYDGTDLRNYPHNMFLEVLSELGLIGFVLFSMLLALGIKNLFYLQTIQGNPQCMGVVLLFVCSFLNILISGDIPDNRTFFCILGLMPYIEYCSDYSSKRGDLSDKAIS
jgi:O-antigen ligase